MEDEYRSYLDAIRDPELRRELTPGYHLGCTRIPKSDRNYYEAVQKPNVHLVRTHHAVRTLTSKAVFTLNSMR